MCFTGGFALAMATEPELLAPVLSQPSLPIALNGARSRARAARTEDLLTVRTRADDEGLCVLGLRFTGDRLVPGERFANLRRELGRQLHRRRDRLVEGQRLGAPRAAHSVLTEDLVDEPGQPTHDALEQVLDLFGERLADPG